MLSLLALLVQKVQTLTRLKACLELSEAALLLLSLLALLVQKSSTDAEGAPRVDRGGAAVAQFTCFTGTKVKY